MVIRPLVFALWLLVLFAGSTQAANGDQPRAGEPAAHLRVAFVPLDDRPVSLRDPQLLAGIAGAELVIPPGDALGHSLKPGDAGAIASWLDALDVSTIDAVIVSADMLAYGGLVGSRLPGIGESQALERIAALERLRQRCADLRVYASSTIMRLAPTDDGRNPGWRTKVGRWAEIAPLAQGDPAVAAEVAAIEESLPAGMLDRYRQARARNRAVTLALIDMTRRGAIDFVAIGQDETSATGVHVADRQAIDTAIGAADLGSRAVVHASADEAGMLLLARALAAAAGYQPRVHVVYSSDASRSTLLADANLPLSQVVESHVQAAGGIVAPDEPRDALLLCVYASRGESPDRAGPFARRIADAAAAGRRVAVADVDTSGGEAGASQPFAEALRNARAFSRLAGYAGAGTAGTTLAAAVSQGVIYGLALDRVASHDAASARQVGLAQATVLVRRVVTDFLYHGVVKPQAVEDMLQPRRIDPARLDPSQLVRVETYVNEELAPLADSLLADFTAAWRLAGRNGSEPLFTIRDLRDFRVTLPWGRMLEADVAFTFVTEPPATR